jgi:cytidine deaminase
MTPQAERKAVRKLVALAMAARDRAYAPYSRHPVGAALLADDGKAYAGANCEFSNYDCTCAENTAIASMASAGGRGIRLLVVVGPSDKYLCTPCGRCRQRIREFSDADTRIYAMKQDGAPGAIYTMEELLPDSFGPENMAVLGLGPQAAAPAAKNKNNNNKTKKKK